MLPFVGAGKAPERAKIVNELLIHHTSVLARLIRLWARVKDCRGKVREEWQSQVARLS